MHRVEPLPLMRRPTRYSQDVVARIIAATRNGATRRAAAAAGGVAESTLYEWLSQGRSDPTSRFAVLVAKLEQADGEAELAVTMAWRGHFDRDWRACAEFLARRFPKEWRRQPSTEVVSNTPAQEQSEYVEPLD